MSKVIDVRKFAEECIKEISETLIADRKMKIAPDFSLDDTQKQLLNANSRLIRVVAPAGSGKTQTLIAKAVNLLTQDSNARVLCLTFTNAAAHEFGNRALNLGVGMMSRLRVSTVNAFGYDALRSSRRSLRVVTPDSRSIGPAYAIIKGMMKESEIWSYKANQRLYRPILDLSDMSKSLGFYHESDEDAARKHLAFLESLGMSSLIEGLMAEAEMPEGPPMNTFVEKWLPFWKDLTTRLWEANLITLDDQKYWSLDEMINSNTVHQWVRNQRFSHIMVDEFQDINYLDLLLSSQVVCISSSNIIIVGDDDQCIYEWRGCTSYFIRKPDYFFKSISQDNVFDTVMLEHNYRCPRNIVHHAKQLIERNQNREQKRMLPIREDNANIRVIPLPAAYVTMNVVDELVSFLAENHPDHTVAIVGRKKCQLLPIQILLTKRGTPFSIDTDLNVFQGKAFKDFRRILEMPLYLHEQRSVGTTVDNVMALLNRVERTPLSKTDRENILRHLHQVSPSTLKAGIEAFSQFPDRFRQGYVDVVQSATRLMKFLDSRSVVDVLHAASDAFKGFQKDFVRSKDDIFYSDPPFSHLADLAVNYRDDLGSFLYDIDSAVEKAASRDGMKAKIEVMTALRTKGREFDTVIALDVNNGIWPSKLAVTNGRIEEERRLFYVTITRAKNNLLMFESLRVQGQQMPPSPFLDELELPRSAWLANPELNTLSRDLRTHLKI